MRGTIDCGSGKFVNNGTLYLDNSGTVNGTFGGSGVFLISVDLPDDTNDLTAFPDTFTYTGEDFAGQIFLGHRRNTGVGRQDFLGDRAHRWLDDHLCQGRPEHGNRD